MEARLVRSLQRVFWIAGWAFLASALVGAMIESRMYFRDNFMFVKSFSLWFVLGQLMTNLGEAFLAFLLSAVFQMIFEQRKPDSQSEAFMRLTCLGYLFKGLIGIYAQGELFWRHVGESNDAFEYALYLFRFTSPVTTLFMAATIYILYRHFTRLITFESEVV